MAVLKIGISDWNNAQSQSEIDPVLFNCMRTDACTRSAIYAIGRTLPTRRTTHEEHMPARRRSVRCDPAKFRHGPWDTRKDRITGRIQLPCFYRFRAAKI